MHDVVLSNGLLDERFSASVYSVPIGIPVPQFATSSKIADMLIPFFDKNPTIDDLRSSKAVRCFKITAALGAILARVPLVRLSTDFFPHIQPLGIAFAACNIVSFSSFLTWSSKDMADQVFYGLKTREVRANQACHNCKTITFIVISVLAGLASQVPYLFLAYNYNQDKPWMVFLGALDIMPPVYSIYLLLNQTFKKTSCSYTNQKIVKIRQYLIQKLDTRLQEIIDGKIDLRESELMINPEMSFEDSLNYFFQDLLHNPSDIEEKNLCVHWTKVKTAQFIGFFLIAMQLFWTGYLSYLGANQITSNKIGLGIIFCCVIISNLALTRFVMISSMYKIIQSTTFYCIRDRSYNYISERLRPSLSFFLTTLAVLIASASFIPALTLSSDFLNPSYYPYDAIFYGAALTIMNIFPLKSLANTGICFMLNRFGSEDEKKAIKIYDLYKSVKRILANSSYDSLGKFLLKLSEQPSIAEVLQKFDVNQEELASFR